VNHVHARLIVALSLVCAAVAPSSQSIDARTDPRVEAARVQFEAGRYADATTTLESVVAAEPENASAYYWLGRTRIELHEYARAVDALKRACELKPQDSEYHRWLGRAYGEVADRERSFSLARRVREQFEEAVRLAPSNIAARRDLMQFYLEAPWILGGGEDKAWSQAAAIAAIDPVAGHLARAACWAHRHDAAGAAKAKAEYQAVLDARPNEVGPYLEAAEYFEKQKDIPGLQAAVDGATRVDPKAPALAYFLGVLDILSGVKPDEAETFLKAYLSGVPPRSDRPSHASAHEWLGRLYESQGRRAEAAAEYKEALRLDPNRRSARESLRRLGQ
jgi:tetratricopeptide (TPR) repeat protein